MAARGSRSPSTTRRRASRARASRSSSRPDDWVMSNKFNEERYWLRPGSSRRLRQAARVRMIVTNAIDAFNQEPSAARRSAVLTTRDADAEVLAAPLLDDEIVEVPRAPEAASREGSRISARTPCARRARQPENTRCGPAGSASTASSRRGRAAGTTRRLISGSSRSATVAAAWCRPRARTDRLAVVSHRGGSLGNVNAYTLTSWAGRWRTSRASRTRSPRRAARPRNHREQSPRAVHDQSATARSPQRYECWRCARRPRSRARAACRTAATAAMSRSRSSQARRVARTDAATGPSNEVLRYVKRYLDEQARRQRAERGAPALQDLSLRVA